MQSPAARVLHTVAALALLGATPLRAADHATVSATVPATETFVPADDARFRFEGRFDISEPTAPVVIWQASRIAIDFEGDSIALRFDQPQGQNVFNVEIDGQLSVIGAGENRLPEPVRFSGLGAGRHQLRLFKRSEAAAGTVRFRGIELAAGAQVFAPAPVSYPVAMLFIGDSITAAACNEDGATDQWADRRTHNNAKGYAALTAAAFSADYRNIAVSGMGVVIGWVEPKAREVWDRIYPNAGSPRADLSAWKPDVVFVNLGENDDSFTTANSLPFPSLTYTDRYVELVQAIRAAYPAARIVILRGGMFGGAKSDRLRAPWEAAVKRIEAADANASHYVFQHWSQTHPRVSDHQAMADELIHWLREQKLVADAR
jgi:lysophospholipase L1-like esterase